MSGAEPCGTDTPSKSSVRAILIPALMAGEVGWRWKSLFEISTKSGLTEGV